MASNKYLDIIKTQRASSKKEKFEGTFLEYLSLVEEDSSITNHAHKKLYEAITEHGLEVLKDGDPRKHKLFDGEDLKTYGYFQEEFFGMEKVIAKVMRFLRSASLKGEESRQVLLLMGPVGAGKSALTEHIKKALEGHAYYYLADDPQRGEPLQLIPRSLRKEMGGMLGVSIEGDISPIARHLLFEEYGGEYEKFKVTETTFSQRARRGIASVPPMDANSPRCFRAYWIRRYLEA